MQELLLQNGFMYSEKIPEGMRSVCELGFLIGDFLLCWTSENPYELTILRGRRAKFQQCLVIEIDEFNLESKLNSLKIALR